MPQVKFEKQIPLSSDVAFKKLTKLLSEAGELKKIDPDICFEVQSDQKKVEAKGKKINGEVTVHEDGTGCIIKLDLSIPWALAPFKALIKSKLEEKISEMC